MRHRFLGIGIIFCIIIASFSALVPYAATSAPVPSKPVAASAEEIRGTRFLNMLNHNFVYNDAFDSADAIVNASVLSLIDLRDHENSDYIADKYVTDFVHSMYGIEITDLYAFNAQYPQRDGFVYIIPAGFTEYHHSLASATQNEDGSWSVVTQVEVTPHDGSAATYKAVSLFVANEASQFGYNLVYSNILTDATDL